MAKPRAAQSIDFEKSMAELETLVDKLERGDLSLEESLRAFERGVELTRSCQSALAQAEQKVEILSQRSGQAAETVAFDTAGAGLDPALD